MSTAELKEEIQKAVKDIPENTPENLLKGVLDQIQEISTKIGEKARRAQYVKEIIAEDEEVFRKLAQ